MLARIGAGESIELSAVEFGEVVSGTVGSMVMLLGSGIALLSRVGPERDGRIILSGTLSAILCWGSGARCRKDTESSRPEGYFTFA